MDGSGNFPDAAPVFRGIFAFADEVKKLLGRLRRSAATAIGRARHSTDEAG